jgi:hypothetical protein
MKVTGRRIEEMVKECCTIKKGWEGKVTGIMAADSLLTGRR